MTRPLLLVFATLFAFVFNSREARSADPEKRPNILFAFADDWGRYASIYADPSVNGPGSPSDLVRTPNIDRVAREGVLFRNAHVTSPSCTPCRSSLLSGQYFFRTGRGAILLGAEWDSKIPTYPLMLKDAGYHIGKIYKVWSPGTPADAPYGGQEHGYEAKGPNFNQFSQVATQMVKDGKSVDEAKAALLAKVGGEFDAFLKARPEGSPFCFWFGPTNVHRKWIKGSGKALWGLEPDQLKGKMPSFLPDVPEIREDFADYLGEAMAFDAGLGVLLDRLEKAGELDNTLVVVSGDHGAPGFPRGKCNLYDFGTGVSLVARWGNGKIPAGRVVDDFVNLMDLAPTFLEAGGVTPPDVMTGRSLMPVLTSEKSGQVDPARTWVITGRERHVDSAREGGLPYPQRAIRTKDHVLIVNFKPDRWPMGSPGPAVTKNSQPSTEDLTENTFAAFADFDSSPTKAWMIEHRNDPEYAGAYELGFAKRPMYELYDLSKDPYEVDNVAGQTDYEAIQKQLEKQLTDELKRVKDPRMSEDPPFEHSPFTDVRQATPGQAKKKKGKAQP